MQSCGTPEGAGAYPALMEPLCDDDLCLIVSDADRDVISDAGNDRLFELIPALIQLPVLHGVFIAVETPCDKTVGL